MHNKLSIECDARTFYQKKKSVQTKDMDEEGEKTTREKAARNTNKINKRSQESKGKKKEKTGRKVQLADRQTAWRVFRNECA